MTTVLLVRHGRTPANERGVLAGWTPGVHLDEVGRAQAKTLGERLARVGVHGVVTSPLERCRETTEIITAGCDPQLPLNSDLDLAECRYGDWTGRALSDLAKDPLWPQVQSRPSAVTFPQGESLSAMQARAVGAIRRWNRRYGPDGVYVAVSHGDVIKGILADALGMHFDMFQRIVVGPCSVSVVSFTDHRPLILAMNDHGSDLAALVGRPRSGAAAVGGGAG